MGIVFWIFMAVTALSAAVFIVAGRLKTGGACVLLRNSGWKAAGLTVSLAWEALFWILYLSLTLEKLGSVLFADLLWIGGGISGVVFGTFSLIGQSKTHLKILSFIALLIGMIMLALWALATLISKM